MGYDKNSNRAHCFGCDASYDIFDLVGIYFGIDDKGEQFKKVQSLYGGGSTSLPQPKKKKVQNKEKNIEDIKQYIIDCKANIYKTDYFEKRGLTNETIERCNLGYDEKENAVVIPYSKAMDYFQRRSVVDKKFFKPKTEDAGQEPLYNAQALKLKTRKPIFIVESPICAMSIIQCGGMAVALCGTGLEKLLAKIRTKKPLGTLVLALDNDDAGELAKTKLIGKLREIDAKFLVYNIAGDCKDPNELLMKEPTKLQNNIEHAIKEAKKLTATKYDSIPLEELLKKQFKPRTWVVKDLIPKGLTLLASPTKAGKSWMMLQLSQCVAEGRDFLGYESVKSEVEYLALEDDEQRIAERTLIQRNGKPFEHGVHITTKAPTMDRDVLLDTLAEKLEENDKIKMFIIDTLQKVRKTRMDKESSNAYASDYAEIGQLKEFADDNDVAIVIVHHARKSIDEVDPYSNILGSVALQGVVDTMMVINNRKQDEIMFYAKGRDIGQVARVIELDDDKKGKTFLWSIVGTPEEQAKAREKREYENNPLVITIKELLKNNPSGWSGNSTDIMNAMYDITKQVVCVTTTQIGKDLQNLATRLHRDGIDFTTKRTGAKRIHTFTYNKKPSWMNSMPSYQPKFYD
ncbi:MAG: AAA family ATPase [Clostridia bacterium]|nr:AAA family ATPase [Clostridia bacterium]